MRLSVYLALALTGVAGLTPAFASPGDHAKLSAGSPSPHRHVDLSLRPSTLERVEDTGPLSLPSPSNPPEPRGQFVGPIWLDGVYAQHLKRLPAHMRRGMAQPVGPTMVVVDTPRVGTTGGGGGVYARF